MRTHNQHSLSILKKRKFRLLQFAFRGTIVSYWTRFSLSLARYFGLFSENIFLVFKLSNTSTMGVESMSEYVCVCVWV